LAEGREYTEPTGLPGIAGAGGALVIVKPSGAGEALVIPLLSPIETGGGSFLVITADARSSDTGLNVAGEKFGVEDDRGIVPGTMFGVEDTRGNATGAIFGVAERGTGRVAPGGSLS